MKLLLIGSTLMTFLMTVCFHYKSSQAQQPGESGSPFACNRLGLSPEERKRHFEVVGPALRSLRTAVRELDIGYEFQFPSDRATFQLLAEWSIQERLCCPFFDIELRLEREGGPLWLRLTGREGTKEFIKADGAAWLSK